MLFPELSEIEKSRTSLWRFVAGNWSRGCHHNLWNLRLYSPSWEGSPLLRSAFLVMIFGLRHLACSFCGSVFGKITLKVVRWE